MPLEKTIVKNIVNAIKAKGWFCWKTHGNQYQGSGIPDVIACIDGRMLAIEVKQAGKHPTPIQRATLDKLEASGAWAMVAYGAPEVEDAIDAILEGY